MNQTIPARPSRRPANYITADVDPKFKYEHSTITLIVDAKVHRIPIRDEQNMHEEFYDVLGAHWHRKDVYISLENRNGVLIRQAERRDGVEQYCAGA